MTDGGVPKPIPIAGALNQALSFCHRQVVDEVVQVLLYNRRSLREI